MKMDLKERLCKGVVSAGSGWDPLPLGVANIAGVAYRSSRCEATTGACSARPEN
jgi:hypothetical protein